MMYYNEIYPTPQQLNMDPDYIFNPTNEEFVRKPKAHRYIDDFCAPIPDPEHDGECCRGDFWFEELHRLEEIYLIYNNGMQGGFLK